MDTRGPREGEITQVPGAEAQPRGHLQRRPSEAPGAICMRYPHVLREHDLETRVHRREPMCVHIMVPWAPAVLPEEPCSAPGGAPALLLEVSGVSWWDVQGADGAVALEMSQRPQAA